MSVPVRGNKHGLAGKILVDSGIGVSGRRTAECDQDLKRIDHKKFLANKPELPPHRDFNDKWDDEEDWPKKDQPKK